MSAKKARKTRPTKPPEPSSTAQAGRPKKPERSAARDERLARKRALSPLEVQLRKALAEMGLARARRVFAAVEASFDD
jgi:hypothetical protein